MPKLHVQAKRTIIPNMSSAFEIECAYYKRCSICLESFSGGFYPVFGVYAHRECIKPHLIHSYYVYTRYVEQAQIPYRTRGKEPYQYKAYWLKDEGYVPRSATLEGWFRAMDVEEKEYLHLFSVTKKRNLDEAHAVFLEDDANKRRKKEAKLSHSENRKLAARIFGVKTQKVLLSFLEEFEHLFEETTSLKMLVNEGKLLKKLATLNPVFSPILENTPACLVFAKTRAIKACAFKARTRFFSRFTGYSDCLKNDVCQYEIHSIPHERTYSRVMGDILHLRIFQSWITVKYNLDFSEAPDLQSLADVIGYRHAVRTDLRFQHLKMYEDLATAFCWSQEKKNSIWISPRCPKCRFRAISKRCIIGLCGPCCKGPCFF